MKKCQRLREYSIFIQKVRDYQKLENQIEVAIDRAVDDCVQAGVLENVLRENREEVRSIMLSEYNEQAHIENERRIAAEEAYAEGIEQGAELFASLASKLLEDLRTEDLLKASKDKDFRDKLYDEYGIKR